MNLILISADELNPNHSIQLTDRRFKHIRKVHRAEVGDALKVGVINGELGTGEILHIDEQRVTLHVTLNSPPPPPLPVTLILALPRPQMLKRTLQNIAAMGVKELHLLQTRRVEKSYWQTPLLIEETVHEQLLLGLEQGRDTVLPRLYFHKRFRPFVEDELAQLTEDQHKLVAHPGDFPHCPANVNEPTTLAIGPEGGFVDFEIEKLQAVGFKPIQMGARILRVETAVPALLYRLFGHLA
ncbi:16S rRNA (uracil(1498)-N(3))-methyltransferase [Marinibactrum halimedae]|uniref:Ribosomal RNA small subunit methyltransferase E n=1 Tax=Marinibactrum halimedae TaxID=1444977 RepID=A0AA37TBV8_9GAMM|nr:16S rRNA (uracil(1498)-N(3))-methyltransferase [Marinibactrum halimedae]MCD9460881.1 16S rRNA (uracil(1498)-N(3))-methyltransferase [Marinibactrum halimedae]GLS27341.1 ribosomal RNA small subunit methyltransferase E [Marinibactrum halimedae]